MINGTNEGHNHQLDRMSLLAWAFAGAPTCVTLYHPTVIVGPWPACQRLLTALHI